MMNRMEKKCIEKLKGEMIRKKRSADEVFNRSKWDYEAVDECRKRIADQDYGYALGIYQVLASLNAITEYPDFDAIK